MPLNPITPDSIDQNWVDNLNAVYTKARQALNANQNFLNLATPTNAQVLNQVQLLTREVNGLIRVLLLNDLSTIADT